MIAVCPRLMLLVLVLLLTTSVDAQISSSRLIREGDGYFEQGQYRAALKYYQEAGNPDTWKKDTYLRVGICQYEINRIDEAIQTLGYLLEEEKTVEEVYLYLAQAHQHRNEYETAIRFYKQFLRKENKDTPTRAWVKDEIKRCANGLHLKYGEETAYVENLGVVVNSLDDEIGPIPSPTIENRLYFASNRAGSTGNKLLPDGSPDSKYGDLPFDIYVTRKESGSWQQPAPMPGAFNTVLNDIILDFSLDGQIGYFYQSDRLTAGRIISDTFNITQDGPARQGDFTGPMKPAFGDTDLRVFNDTILLFSSARPGGYGGYDIYMSVNRYGIWQPAMNLGPVINSFYDDRYPFLAQNGRVLFYSSNNLNSIGGHDIFRVDYDDKTGSWSEAQNLGIPVNSPADEMQFNLAADGLTAFIASSRKTGFGGFDLYSIYFKKQVRENLRISTPVTFYQHAEQMVRIRPDTSIGEVQPARTQMADEKEFYISDLYYGADDVVITPQNIKKLDLMANMMLIYPKLRLELVCHETSDVRSAFSLYFSVKKAEKVLEYLAQKGVDPNRINLKGAGDYFPLEVDGQASPFIRKLNRRISVRFHQTQGEPIRIFREKQVLPEEVDESRLYETLTEDLYYMVQIAATTQMLQSPLLDRQDHAVIEYLYPRKIYRYLVGLSTSFEGIKPVKEAMRENGFGDAFIVPFISGMRVERDQILNYSEQYPDLLNLFE